MFNLISSDLDTSTTKKIRGHENCTLLLVYSLNIDETEDKVKNPLRFGRFVFSQKMYSLLVPYQNLMGD
jgi:hypothetical protein